jgi:DNA repair protein RadC
MEKHYGLGHIKRLKARFAEGKTAKQEIIELLLSYPVKGRDVKAQAHRIFVKSGGNFRKVFDVVANEDIDGVGAETKTFFFVIRAFLEVHSSESFSNKRFRASTQADIITYFRNVCADMNREAVYAVFLDAKNKITGNKSLSEGTLTQSLLYPREIIAEAIKRGALGMVLLHNHPSGDATPSENDRRVTRKMLFAAKEMDLNLLDHIIIGTEGKGYYSFHEDGLIQKYNNDHKVLNSEF